MGFVPVPDPSCYVPLPQPPAPPPLTCTFTGHDAPEGTNRNLAGMGAAFVNPITLSYEASGGTGDYVWSVFQLICRFGTVTYDNGAVYHGPATWTLDTLFGSQLTPNGSTASFYDSPGVLYVHPQTGAHAVSANFTFFLQTYVSVTSGGETTNVSHYQLDGIGELAKERPAGRDGQRDRHNAGRGPAMTSRVPRCCAIVLPAIWSLIASNVLGQTRERTPAELIGLLTYQSGRDADPDIAAFTCGTLVREATANRAIARSLAMLGSAALPDIEAALSSVRQRGQQSEFWIGSDWLLFAYAKISGPKAYPQLRMMIEDPPSQSLGHALDVGIAISLGLTSYVSSTGLPTDVLCRAQEPRDSLDRVILAWDSGDRPTLERNLGPNGKVALEELLKGKSWAALRAEFGLGSYLGSMAVGYRLKTVNRWSESEETLEQPRATVDFAKDPLDPELDTLFTDSSGLDCGSHRVRFVTPRRTAAPAPPYLIDNRDLRDLLGRISSCALRGAR